MNGANSSVGGSDSRSFLATASRKRPAGPGSLRRDDRMEIVPLGSGVEVGRSCHILRYKGKTVMLDCGMHPGYSGPGALPFFDEIDPAKVDLLLITHFHIDHAAGLPYFTEKTAFKGRIFMTYPTKVILKMVIADSLVVSNDMLFDDRDLDRCLKKVEVIGVNQQMEVDGIRFHCYNAGHVLGASMFMIEIAGIRTLYTGDYTREEDRHLMAADVPTQSPDVLICEATLGKMTVPSRESRERRLLEHIEKVLHRGGRCLIPMFALGRAQEIMLILEEHWTANPKLQRFPIYYANKVADRALRVYQTFANVMNEHVKSKLNIRNPFKFRHIHQLRNINFDDQEPCVFLASPGMLQSGLSRKLFERWCPDPRNSCLIPGYSVEGTLVKKLKDSMPDEILGMDGTKILRKCSVEEISFIAHADYPETRDFVKLLQPPKIVLVHGAQDGMRSLAKRLAQLNGVNEVLTPRNTELVTFYFRRDKFARIVGKLAEGKPTPGQPVKGVFVTENFVHHVISTEDISTYTRLSLNSIKQRLHVPYGNQYDLLKLFIGDIFDLEFVDPPKGTEKWNPDAAPTKNPAIRISKAVTLTHRPPDRVLIEWNASPVNDMVADAVATIVMQAGTSPACVQVTSKPCSHDHPHDHRMADVEGVGDFEEKQLKFLYILRKTLKEKYLRSGASVWTPEQVGKDVGEGQFFDTVYTVFAEEEKMIVYCSLATGKFKIHREKKPDEAVPVAPVDVDMALEEHSGGMKEQDTVEDFPFDYEDFERCIDQLLLCMSGSAYKAIGRLSEYVESKDSLKVAQDLPPLTAEDKAKMKLENEKYWSDLAVKAVKDAVAEIDADEEQREAERIALAEAGLEAPVEITEGTSGSVSKGGLPLYARGFGDPVTPETELEKELMALGATSSEIELMRLLDPTNPTYLGGEMAANTEIEKKN
jgi:cleavage and polyadenylation specificity factor subunit 3